MRPIAWLRPVLAACALLAIQVGTVAADGPHCDLARAPAIAARR